MDVRMLDGLLGTGFVECGRLQCNASLSKPQILATAYAHALHRVSHPWLQQCCSSSKRRDLSSLVAKLALATVRSLVDNLSPLSATSVTLRCRCSRTFCHDSSLLPRFLHFAARRCRLRQIRFIPQRYRGWPLRFTTQGARHDLPAVLCFASPLLLMRCVSRCYLPKTTRLLPLRPGRRPRRAVRRLAALHH